MVYLFQAVLFVFILASIALAGIFWSGLHCNENLPGKTKQSRLPYKSVAIGSGFVIYVVLDYAMLDYLMLIPGANYVVT